jgi:hypothetical protein
MCVPEPNDPQDAVVATEYKGDRKKLNSMLDNGSRNLLAQQLTKEKYQN